MDRETPQNVLKPRLCGVFVFYFGVKPVITKMGVGFMHTYNLQSLSFDL